MSTTAFFELIGGVGLFLYAIKLMGESLQDLAGDRLRQLISSLTSTPVKGVLVGTLVTVLIQSSSATTVMTVSFVHAGLMTLKQAVGVIMGANIGTTVTAQLIAFKIKHYALPIIAAGMILAVFGRTKKQKYLGNGMVGFGLLFLGMQHMGDAMKFLRGREDIFLAFSHHPVLGVLAGMGLTMLVQSSSATVGLTIAMASQGLLTLDSAIPILLGDNIGTTITAVIACLGSNRSAKQAAAGHVMFNVIGVGIFMLTLPFFKSAVLMTSGDIARQLANAHTLFNVVNTLLFLPFTSLFVKLIQIIIPSRETMFYTGPQFLDTKLIDASPAAAVDAVRKEIIRMGELTREMMRDVHNAYVNDDPHMIEQVNQTEKILNELTHKVAQYSSELWQKSLSEELSVVLSSYVNGLGDLERIGDHAQNLIELYEFKRDNKLPFSTKAMEEFEEMFSNTNRAVELSLESIRDEDTRKAREVIEVLEKKIDAMEKELRIRHIKRLNQGRCHPSAGVVFIDILSNMERIGDHAHNLSFIVMDVAKLRGEK
ncbi:MAG: Na/Pi cotransporter family protein [Synergistales bacterium]|nr:Na/Pi cotransporter family protein [Synergistales bacterium]